MDEPELKITDAGNPDIAPSQRRQKQT